ncbi:MAG: diguanylate cyclase, partial [Bacteroidales bacterium]|nr:diguanylate cyclase [Bacteroidales bacterium]
FMSKEIDIFFQNERPFAVFLLSIDNLADINLKYGIDEGNTCLQNLAYIFKQMITGSEQVFRLEGGVFAMHSTDIDRQQALEKAISLKNNVFESRLFITPVSISIGLYHSEEIPKDITHSSDKVKEIIFQTARFRLTAAKKEGKNSLVYDSDQETSVNAAFTVLLVDEPGLPRELIRKSLENDNYRVIIADNGFQARLLAEEQAPDIIISELMTSKLSAFTLRKELFNSSGKKHIPFILMSHDKNEATISRALGLEITYFLSRPVILIELLGIVDFLASRRKREDG